MNEISLKEIDFHAEINSEQPSFRARAHRDDYKKNINFEGK